MDPTAHPEKRSIHMDLGGFPQRAEAWLAALDAATLRRARRTQLETLADAAFALIGVLLLGWSPYPLLLFLIAGLWLGLLETVTGWLLDRDRLTRILRESEDVDEARAIARRERDGMVEDLSQRSLPGGFGTQLAIAIGFAGAFTASLLYQLADTVGITVGSLLLDRPDMLFIMGGLLVLRLYGLVQRARQSEENAPWLLTVSPMLDTFLFIALILCWSVIAAIALKIEEIVGGDRQAIAATVFVCAGYGLILWRAANEWRDLGRLRQDLTWILNARDQGG